MSVHFKNLFHLLLPVALVCVMGSCKEDPEEVKPEEVSLPTLEVPTRYNIIKGEPRVITLGVKSGKVEASDRISLEPEGQGVFTPCDITEITAETVSFEFPAKFSNGTYNVSYKRGASSRSYGPMEISIIEKTFEPQPGTTVYGTVTTEDGGPVAGVLISDGFIFAQTDAEGCYEMQSTKPLGYVFMVVPSGYEPLREGVFPSIHKTLRDEPDVPEIANFSLVKMDRKNYKVLFLGDMHLANRTSDLSQYKNFTDDINEYRKQHSTEKVYGITLGDMSWDLYWYDKKFGLSNYVETINGAVSDMTIYHTIGNHDNDFKATNNMDAKSMFRKTVAPNYYSFNIGDIHYIILDDIDCSTYDGTTSRIYQERLVTEQLNWLAKDLSYVDKSTPVFVMMHAPVYGIQNATQFKLHMGSAQQLINALDGYKVHFVTGHTHKNYNVTPSHTVVGGKDIHEHNVAAVCGSWWWSGHLTTGVHLSQDGAPGGFAIWDIDGKDMKWLYKGTGKSEDYQFRAYDLNNVKFTDADVPNLQKGTSAYNDFGRYKSAYPGKQNDEVLINVWNYNPSWKITVTQEDGRQLTPIPCQAYDPLHIAAMSVKRYNSSSVTSSPSFVTSMYPHFFKVACDNHDVDITIQVEDEFGHKWVEKMERPKAFSIEAYK